MADQKLNDKSITALTPRNSGYQFAFYGDSCSGIPSTLHAEKLAKINSVVRRFDPKPEFIVFPGDEIVGLTPDEAELRKQWRHFLDFEMEWLQDIQIPIYHSTGNHTTYDKMSEGVFAEVMTHLPKNGPADQLGLSYFVREGELLLVFVHTLWSGLGGEGHMELDWLKQTLEKNAEAQWKFVIGHHPAFPVNGYVGSYQRNIGDEYVTDFWRILSDHNVIAYLCSHILAFDVQCQAGVLQVTSAGAGTAHRMPEAVEYLHCVQMAVDEDGLRYQVLDEEGEVRERLTWPPQDQMALEHLNRGYNACPLSGKQCSSLVTRLKVHGTVSATNAQQTVLAALEQNGTCPLWIGLIGPQRQLTIIMQPQTGRSPHRWLGPCFSDDERLDLEILLNGEMGPGGFLWRASEAKEWNGFLGFSAWGTERLVWPDHLHIGQKHQHDVDSRFQGELSVSMGTASV
ncbi:MAG: metallophosphoesterase [Pseudomonadota bacterium]